MNSIPVSVIIVTRNEEGRIRACLRCLGAFDDGIVVDSGSTDSTAKIARDSGAHVENFTWNGRYPKKRQWCLDRLQLKHDWVFFVDADELVPPAAVQEISALFENGKTPPHDGYFIRSHYMCGMKPIRHGLQNKKLVLFNRKKFCFPVIDDLDLPGMGEIEGHYQPVAKDGTSVKIGTLQNAMLHYADPGSISWLERHQRYAAWEAGMNKKNAWPQDPVPVRQTLKTLFRNLPSRPAIAFFHSYVLKAGFLDGPEGKRLARSRAAYYRMIAEEMKKSAPPEPPVERGADAAE